MDSELNENLPFPWSMPRHSFWIPCNKTDCLDLHRVEQSDEDEMDCKPFPVSPNDFELFFFSMHSSPSSESNWMDFRPDIVSETANSMIHPTAVAKINKSHPIPIPKSIQ